MGFDFYYSYEARLLSRYSTLDDGRVIIQRVTMDEVIIYADLITSGDYDDGFTAISLCSDVNGISPSGCPRRLHATNVFCTFDRFHAHLFIRIGAKYYPKEGFTTSDFVSAVESLPAPPD